MRKRVWLNKKRAEEEVGRRLGGYCRRGGLDQAELAEETGVAGRKRDGERANVARLRLLLVRPGALDEAVLSCEPDQGRNKGSA